MGGSLIDPYPVEMSKGIHQGDPLSVAGYNCMMAPLIDLVEEKDEEANICVYADDISTHCESKERIEEVAKLCIIFLDDCGIMVNQDKTQYMQIGSEAGPLRLPDAAVTPMEEVTVLGVRYFAHGDALDPARSGKAKRHLQRMSQKLDAIPLNETCKENVVGAMIMPRLNYQTWDYIHTARDACSLRTTILSTLRKQIARGPRSTGLMHSLIFKQHRIDPAWSRCWNLLRLLIKTGDMGMWKRCQVYLSQQAPPVGPWSTLAYYFRQAGIRLNDGVMQDILGNHIECYVPPEPYKKTAWLHALRDALRQPVFQLAAQGRSDMEGLDIPLDTDKTTNYLRSLTVTRSRKIMEQMLVGGYITKDREQRWNNRGTGLCAHCGLQDTMRHRFWECNRWEALRPRALPDHRTLPNCVTSAGLIPQCLDIDMMTCTKIHHMYLSIMIAFQAAEQGRILSSRPRRSST